MLTRRNFVKLAGTGALPLITIPGLVVEDPFSTMFDHPAGPVIKSFTIFNSTGSFYRFIGMNASDNAPKGINKTRKSFIVELSDGSFGIGPVGYSRVDAQLIFKLKQLIGKDPFTFYRWENDRIVGPTPAIQEYLFNGEISWIESAFLDVIGKQRKLPVWKLMGNSIREGIDPYDGTMYFEDIANNTDVRIIGEIGKRIKEDGYRAIKIKMGRPLKWLPGEAGVHRDIEAFIALREAVGQNFNLMADANNGYKNNFDWAVKLLSSCAPYNIYYMEELFPDDTQQYLRLREALMKKNFFVPIAEGENMSKELEKFDQYLKDGVYNYIQPDMATSGFSNIIRTAKKAENYPHVKLIPHVWQSQLGLIMSLHASKIQSNITYVEDSRYFEHAFNTSGYLFKDGQWFIPDKPGWGVELAPDYKQYITGEEIRITI